VPRGPLPNIASSINEHLPAAGSWSAGSLQPTIEHAARSPGRPRLGRRTDEADWSAAISAAPTTTLLARQARAPSRPPASTTPKPKPAPGPETIVGLWPVRTLEQARKIQDGADAGHQPWLLSPELVSTSYATAEYGISDPVARKVGPAAYDVGARNSEWVATLHLGQPVRQGAGGVWVITRTANPAGSY
jgi:hypothetical protein